MLISLRPINAVKSFLSTLTLNWIFQCWNLLETCALISNQLRSCFCFRYISDQAFNGYKSYCQHKLLCWDMNGSPVARSHPPSMLEWQAAKMRVNMAAECHFPDGMKHSAVSSSILITGWKNLYLNVYTIKFSLVV